MKRSQPESDKKKLITVLKTGSQAKIVVAQSILNSADIFNFTKNETIQNLFGLGAIGGFNPLIGPMELQVESERFEEAKDLLSEIIEDGN